MMPFSSRVRRKRLREAAGLDRAMEASAQPQQRDGLAHTRQCVEDQPVIVSADAAVGEHEGHEADLGLSANEFRRHDAGAGSEGHGCAWAPLCLDIPLEQVRMGAMRRLAR
ncbi:hypothetical protein C5C13_06225 [Clavibacter michiganensis]|nr:hypothetical protein C5C13_06225 [Clavibacter michiganensis]